MSPDATRVDGDALDPSAADDGWVQVLAELEHAVHAPEREWTPPEHLPPLPQRHRDHAERLLAALQRRRAEVAAEASALQTELRLLHTVGAGPDSAVYLDLRC